MLRPVAAGAEAEAMDAAANRRDVLTTVGATAAELLANMTRHQLTFGPAAPGAEDAYHALHRGLVDYYAALSRPKK